MGEFFKDKATKGLRIGQACHRLFVLFKDQSLEEWPQALEFASQHEAFHLAAQLYGSKVPLAFLAARQDPGSAGESFFHELSSITADAGARLELADLCGVLRRSYLPLPGPVRARIDALAYWEWPAEYYAYQTMASRDDSFPARYRGIRSHIGSLAEYAPGVGIGILLDRKLGRPGWQSRAAAGATMIEIAADLCRMEIKSAKRGAARITTYHLFGE